MAKRDPWHYPRTAAAKAHLGLITSGMTNALVLFGRRRTGKTEFLLQDFAPAAEQAKCLVVYVSFWLSPLSPAATILQALEMALQGGSLAARLGEAAKRISPKLTLSGEAGGFGAKAEIDLTTLRGEPPADVLLRIDALIGALAQTRKRVLILFDEVQDLAGDRNNAPLVATLRTSLDTRRNDVAAVFTGSNRDRLNAMFARRGAPFFQFATPIELPPLDEDFVDYLLATFETITGFKLNRKAALEAFEQSHASPFFFRKLLELAALDPERNLAKCAVKLRARLVSDLGFDHTWLSLSPLERALVKSLAGDERAPFSEEHRKKLGAMLGGPTPSAAQVQSGLRRLMRLDMVSRLDGRSDYALDDPEFGVWAVAHGIV
ncbi:MAG: hypothetical protein GC189_08750 [Alphaproteobacteria bacterium]|nr:hypothetical protein [Alphaproteobacteria bacterium]